MNKLETMCTSAAILDNDILIWHVALSLAYSFCIYCNHDRLIDTQVLEAGRQAGSVPVPVIPGTNGYRRNPIVNLMYTSGSSGRPKGAEYTESMYCSFLQVAFKHHNSLHALTITPSPAVPAHYFPLFLEVN